MKTLVQTFIFHTEHRRTPVAVYREIIGREIQQVIH